MRDASCFFPGKKLSCTKNQEMNNDDNEFYDTPSTLSVGRGWTEMEGRTDDDDDDDANDNEIV